MTSRNGHEDPAALAAAGPVTLLRYRSGAVGETARTVHLVRLPACEERPGAVTALCGALLRPDQIEIVTPGEGVPCTGCLVSRAASLPVQDLEATPAAGPLAGETPATVGLADYQAWGWPVSLRHNQIWLRLQPDPIAIMIPDPLAESVATILTTRHCPPAVLAHPYASGHRVLLAGERYGVTLPWPAGVQQITGTVLLPPSVTPRGPVTWLQPPGPDTLRLCREFDLFAALRTAAADQLTQARGDDQ